MGVTYVWNEYSPSIVETMFVFGSFALVGILLLIFAKFFPPIPIWEQKEGQIVRAEIQVGRATVQAVIKEE